MRGDRTLENMNHPTFRAFVSLWLMFCMLFAVTPLGCHSGNVRQTPGHVGQRYLPEVTAKQLQECGRFVQEGIAPGRRAIDARVKLNENGRVLDATTTGEPNPDVGMCIRGVLREMQVDKGVIEEASLRSRSSESPIAETRPNRTYIGQTETVVVVVFVVEVIIVDEVMVALGLTVTASLAATAIHGAPSSNATQSAGTPRGTRKPHQPNAKKWLENGGSIDGKADGTTTYTRSDGVAVTYDAAGFPDLTPYRHATVKDVQIEFTGSYKKDFALADKAAGITEEKRQVDGYTWHHHQDGKTMQLIKKDVHKDFFHTGGMSGTRK